jgi:hypothetical protein
MKRRALFALPALAPVPALAFRAEPLAQTYVAEVTASFEQRCARSDFHAELATTLDTQGAALPDDKRAELATCPFCQCKVAWVPSANPR